MMSATWTYRLLLALAMLGPFLFWTVNQSYGLGVDWRWALVVPLAVAGYAVIEAWQRRLKDRLQFVVLAAIVLAFWVAAAIGSKVNDNSGHSLGGDTTALPSVMSGP
jgi:peptidoglycan/LPS O-acetylase OafA/YrhL